MSFPLPPDALDRDLVFEFFWKFSVFECALKRSGFLKKKKKIAEPDWDDFASKIDDQFNALDSPGFREAVAKIIRLSPRRLMNRELKLKWEPMERELNQTDAVYVSRLLRNVRNNLFHGGKYPDGQQFEIARDREILRTALTILDGYYELHPGIQCLIREIAA